MAATVQVQVASKDGPQPLPPPLSPVQRGACWEGDVPPRQWMNLYTKVLSRFATTPGLKLHVRFELPADDSVTDTKTAETRTALRELGLDDDVVQS
jgi:hypothetical protein